MKKILTIISLIVALAACEEEYNSPPKSLLEATILYSNGSTSSTPKVSVYGVGQDSLLIYQEKLKSFRLPLNNYESTGFVVLLDSIPDTLTIHHQNTFNYESIETGFYYEFWIDSIEHTFNRIDSVVVADSAVTKNWHENIKLYIGPVPAVDN